MHTPLYSAHTAVGGKLIDFAGYLMPVQYKDGIIAEHQWTRSACGIFDVSHMGQLLIEGEYAATLLSRVTPSNISLLKDGVCKYTVLLNADGGIIDDLIITRIRSGVFFVVLNASRKAADTAYIAHHNVFNVTLESMPTRCLIAVQGPKALDCVSRIFDEVKQVQYMHGLEFLHPLYGRVFITRTGYTGELGCELSLETDVGLDVWHKLSAMSEVRPIGLGARDSLRLEAGYPLYGNDLTEETTPVEAGLSWVVSKKHTGFIGEDVIFSQLNGGTKRARHGIKLIGRGVLRSGYHVLDSSGNIIGVLSSGGFAPTLGCSIGQAYLPTDLLGTRVFVDIRGNKLEAEVCPPSFYQARCK